MEHAVKECNGCDSFNEETWIPKDMFELSFKCPYCPHGTVTYRQFTKEDLFWNSP